MTAKDAYQVSEPAHGSIALQTGERFDFSFDAGSVAPKSEEETAALEHLVSLGFAKAPKAAKAEEA